MPGSENSTTDGFRSEISTSLREIIVAASDKDLLRGGSKIIIN